MYALAYANQVQKIESGLPPSARLLVGGQPTGGWVMGLSDASVAQQEACGWFVVVEVAPPSVTATQRLVGPTIELVAGRPTQVWSTRAETAEELAQRTRTANLTTMTNTAAVVAKMDELKTFLVDPDIQVLLDKPNATAPTAQEQNRGNKAMIRQLRREANFLMLLARLELGRSNPTFLDDISDT